MGPRSELVLLILKTVTESASDLLQTLARSFRNEKEREDRSSKAEATEEKVSTPAKLELHLRNNNATDEIS